MGRFTACIFKLTRRGCVSFIERIEDAAMNRSSIVASLSLVMLLTGCPDPAKNKTQAVVEAPKAVPSAVAQPLVGATTYAFSNDGSKFGFVGAKVTGKHEGGFNVFSGTIEVPGTDLTKARVKATVSVKSVFTDSEKLTAHLQSGDFFDAEKFPEATFVSTAIAANGGAFTVTGDLSLHGVTKSITFPAKLSLSGDVVKVNADFAINRKDFAIVYAGKADDLIADNVAIVLDLTAKKG
jgi:polyisoprenoid-binding protein YceI